MIYLERERKAFEETKREFEAAFTAALEDIFTRFKSKGALRDAGSPIHHRQTPSFQLGVIQAKCHRVNAALEQPGWEHDAKLRAVVIEEAGDIANYALYIAALCLMLDKEAL